MSSKRLRMLVLLILIMVAALRYYFWWPNFTASDLAFYNDSKKVTFNALIVKEPKKSVDALSLVVEGKELEGRVLIKTKLYPQYYYGDLLEVSCSLKSPQKIEDFSYDKYLAKDKIYSLCYQPQIKLISSGQGNYFYSTVFKIKNSLSEVIDRSLPLTSAVLLKGILLGDIAEMPERLRVDFSKTGVNHIVAVSGMNITIISAILFDFFLNIGLRRKVTFYVVILVLVIFVLMIGAPASAVRALIMGGMVLLARQVGRVADCLWSLGLTAIVMTVLNPLLLFYDVGFQLSFLALFSMIKFGDKIEALFNKLPFNIPEFLGIRESLITTLSAQVTTMPLIIYYFGVVSIVAPLSNLLILFPLPFLTVVGFIFCVVGLFSLGLARVLFWFLGLILIYIIKVIETLANFNFSAVLGLEVGWWFLGICYLAIAIWLYGNKTWNYIAYLKL